MAEAINIDAIKELPADQRWTLILRIWDTLAEDDSAIEVSDETKNMIRRRVQEMKDHPENNVSQKEMLGWLRAQK